MSIKLLGSRYSGMICRTNLNTANSNGKIATLCKYCRSLLHQTGMSVPQTSKIFLRNMATYRETLMNKPDTIPQSKKAAKAEDDDSPLMKTLVEHKNHQEIKTASRGIIPGKGPPPEPPEYCCMSNCPNCVYIDYVDKLKEYYQDGGEKAKEAIKQIEDPNIRMFLLLELNLK